MYPLEIITNGTESNCGNPSYSIGSQILFIPDIDPINSFEYPVNYVWDFDDGEIYTDNFDGGGVAIHTYTIPGPHVVKLTISDPNGSIQASKTINICGVVNGGGEWVLSNGTSQPTLVMYYPGDGNPIYSGISFQNNSGVSCFGQNVRWKWQFMEEASSPVVVLNTMPGTNNPVLFEKCNNPNEYLPQHEYGSVYGLDLPTGCMWFNGN